MFTFYTPNLITDTADIALYEDEPLSLASGYDFDPLLTRDEKDAFSWSAGTGTTTSLHCTMGGDVINTIMLKGINFSEFEVHVNSATVTPIGADTSTSHWDNWTDTNFYMQFSSVAANTVEILVYTTTSGGARECAGIIACDEVLELPRNPHFASYKPRLTGLRVPKEMADGGIFTYKVREKYEASFDLNYMDESTAADILDLYRTLTAHYFAPYPTTAGWLGEAYEINLIGDFEFRQPALNDMDEPYYSGAISMRETPGP